MSLQDNGGTANSGVDTSSPEQIIHINISKPYIWHNTKNALQINPMPPTPGLDVNDDGHVAPNDVAAIVNYINAFGKYLNGHVPPRRSTLPNNGEGVDIGKPFGFIDVNCDDFVTAADALAVINVVNTIR